MSGKGQPGPITAGDHATKSKRIVLVFLEANGIIYMNNIPRGKAVDALYIMFLVVLRRRGPSCRPRTGFRKKSPIMSSKDWF